MTTEEKIFEAAFKVFQKKGFTGARMQEIADEAEINKAMLHYFFRSKERLFEAVFMNAFGKLAPQINGIFNSDEALFEKIKKFTDSYISFVMEYPFLPQFIIQEMNNNPEFVTKFLKDEKRPDPTKILKQIESEIELGLIKPIPPKQLLLDVFSMTVFPFAAQTLVKGIINISDEEFFQLMEERKIHISEQIINAIKK
ncbi:transcriptional regulator, TetR family [Flavobacterium saliperosum S13]|uniref:Transcriptional regulator, TetR family n=2 Tax=Flavobacterium saliperosum TaxID=329186 RepID=A0A1G4W058_9FLAO|nr:TetR/AcrR family transcriptional regulator [Flavobacterium saliperosum]ESU27455.1 transcriptional regulator, TetR family [Flavobacterium saliperosum S13]SCX14636.1 transcriptional regulator, TetR family [Flavobacterium saliperosum]